MATHTSPRRSCDDPAIAELGMSNEASYLSVFHLSASHAVPMAVIIDWISCFSGLREPRLFDVDQLTRIGRIAWHGDRPFWPSPGRSPSKYKLVRYGSRSSSRQLARNPPGEEPFEVFPRLRAVHAQGAVRTLSKAFCEWRIRIEESHQPVENTRFRSRRLRVDSFTLVCDSRGDWAADAEQQINPSRTSSPEMAGSLSFTRLFDFAY